MSASRNGPCPCGSGRRYKHCCGATSGAGTIPAGTGPDRAANPFGRHAATMHAALARQNAGDAAGAAALYRQVLAERPDLPDALHMLGVACLSQGRFIEAARAIRRAGELTGWSLPSIRHNYGMAIGARLAGRDDRRAPGPVQSEPGAIAAGVDSNPLVSVVVPSFNHSAYIGEALESVFAQTYRNIELVVIDDGSTDASPALIEAALRHCPFPHRFVARGNRGAAATINEAVRSSQGAFINPLNSDDAFAPDRIATMVARIAARGRQWGFARVLEVDARGRATGNGESESAEARYALRDWLQWSPAGAALLEFNHAISSGNLFFSRALFDTLEGFADFRYNHDWDFALRALWLSEPGFVDMPLYRYRLHDANTIRESGPRALAEADVLLGRYHTRALDGALPANPLAPCVATAGVGYLASVLERGQGSVLTPEQLQRLHDTADARDAAASLRPPAGDAVAPAARVIVATGILDVVNALAAIESAPDVALEDHLVLLGGNVNADADRQRAARGPLVAAARALHRFATIDYVGESTMLRWDDACREHGPAGTIAELRERLGLANVRELSLQHDTGFANLLFMNAFPDATRICFGDGIGYQYHAQYHQRYVVAPREATHATTPSHGAGPLPPDGAMAPPVGTLAGLASLGFDRIHVLLRDVYGDDDARLVRVMDPAFTRAKLEQLARLLDDDWIAALRTEVSDRRVVVLATTMLAEQGKLEAEREVAAYADYLGELGTPPDAHIVVKPHPRSRPAKTALLVTRLAARYAGVSSLAAPALQAFPIEALLPRLVDDVLAGDRSRLSVVAFSTTGFSVPFLFGIPVHLGFGIALIERHFPAAQRAARSAHETRLREVQARVSARVPESAWAVRPVSGAATTREEAAPAARTAAGSRA